MIYVADASIITQLGVSELISKGQLKDAELIIPYPVISEIEQAARENKEIGFVGLAELKEIQEKAASAGIRVTFSSKLNGDSDHVCREIAKLEGAVLLTGDKIQSNLAEVMGIDVLFFEQARSPKLSFEELFDKETMSLHFREGVPIFAKKGSPGKVLMVDVGDKPLTREGVEKIAREIVEKAKRHPEAFIEIDRTGATVVQYGLYRIAIARPPFSDGAEITAVRPAVKLKLEDYALDRKLLERLEQRAEGIVLAGSPGAGKSTFAQALAEHYAERGKLVKTMERPRDLNVSQKITQYGALEGDMEKTSELLLLARPDYTVYDEVRKTSDFEIFADMRLAGVGMIGVVHASRGIDAIQRFLSRVEMGVIPQVVDTVLYMKAGKIEKVYELEMTVKVPAGMTEADLARPVIEVRDFFSGTVEYEIYTFGEETTIIPVKARRSSPSLELAAQRVRQLIEKEIEGARVKVEMVSEGAATIRVPEEFIPHLIGKGGSNIQMLEKKIGLHLSVQSFEEGDSSLSFDLAQTGGNLVLYFSKKLSGQTVDFLLGDKLLFSASIGRRGTLKIDKKSEMAKAILKHEGEISVRPVG